VSKSLADKLLEEKSDSSHPKKEAASSLLALENQLLGPSLSQRKKRPGSKVPPQSTSQTRNQVVYRIHQPYESTASVHIVILVEEELPSQRNGTEVSQR